MTQLRAVSLFSNCGAGDVGYRDAGFSFDVMAELDPLRMSVCLLNHPGAVGVEGDLRDTWPKVIEQYRSKAGDQAPALLCACPPCQGMSSARSGRGKHDDADAGSRDARNLLVTVVVRVARELMPSVIVVENVPAFLTRRVRHPLDDQPVSAANYLISQLADAYEVYPLVVDLAEYGVPQSRTRSFLTLVRRDVPGLAELQRLGRAPFPRPTHAGGPGGRNPVTLGEALHSFALPPLDAASTEMAKVEGFGGLHAVPVWSDRTYQMVAAIPPGSGQSAWQNKRCPHCGPVEVDPSAVACPRCDATLLRPIVEQQDGTRRLVRGFKSSYRRMYPDRPAATVTTASGHIGSDYTIHPTENRLLSVLECARLQTFPEDFRWGEALKKGGPTNVREMIGEAVPPAFTQQHGSAIASMLGATWSIAPISVSDDRCQKAWTKLKAAHAADGRGPDPAVPVITAD